MGVFGAIGRAAAGVVRRGAGQVAGVARGLGERVRALPGEVAREAAATVIGPELAGRAIGRAGEAWQALRGRFGPQPPEVPVDIPPAEVPERPVGAMDITPIVSSLEGVRLAVQTTGARNIQAVSMLEGTISSSGSRTASAVAESMGDSVTTTEELMRVIELENEDTIFQLRQIQKEVRKSGTGMEGFFSGKKGILGRIGGFLTGGRGIGGLLKTGLGGIARGGIGGMLGSAGLVAGAGAIGFGIGKLINEQIDKALGEKGGLGKRIFDWLHPKEVTKWGEELAITKGAVTVEQAQERVGELQSRLEKAKETGWVETKAEKQKIRQLEADVFLAERIVAARKRETKEIQKASEIRVETEKEVVKETQKASEIKTQEVKEVVKETQKASEIKTQEVKEVVKETQKVIPIEDAVSRVQVVPGVTQAAQVPVTPSKEVTDISRVEKERIVTEKMQIVKESPETLDTLGSIKDELKQINRKTGYQEKVDTRDFQDDPFVKLLATGAM